MVRDFSCRVANTATCNRVTGCDPKTVRPAGRFPDPSAGLVAATILALGEVEQLALEQLTAQRSDAVGEDHPFDMVVLVLDDPSLKARELLVVLHEIGIHVAHADRQRPGNVGMDAREGEAALVVGLLLVGIGVDLGIDEGPLVVRTRRVVLGPRRAIDDEQADILADLRSGQTDPFGLLEREEHVLNELFEPRVVRGDLVTVLAQHLVTVYYDRINHFSNSI